jgi:hypothetical protein
VQNDERPTIVPLQLLSSGRTNGDRRSGALKAEKIMPRKKSLRGASAKEERQYEHIKKQAQRSGRYGKRAKEVAARTVMKQRSKKKRSKKK